MTKGFIVCVYEKIEDEESVISEITPNVYTELKNNNVIHSGMIPKIENCFDALKKGVSEVKLGSPRMISGESKYTKIFLDDE